jgi:hypothetical protein
MSKPREWFQPFKLQHWELKKRIKTNYPFPLTSVRGQRIERKWALGPYFYGLITVKHF